MAFIRGKNGQKGRQRWNAACRHCQVIEDYRAARDAWEELRWSEDDSGGRVAGTAGSGVGYYQLTDLEFRQIYPMPLFKDFLIALREEREAAQAAYADEEESW